MDGMFGISGQAEMRSCDQARRHWFDARPKDQGGPVHINFQDLREIREAARDEADGGGRALETAFLVEQYYGHPAVSGVYLAEDGEPIALHSWNILADGSVLDATLDQFGEERDVRIAPVGSQEWRRYRMEWTQHYNPTSGHDELAGCIWSGQTDMARIMARREASQGHAWWIPGGSSPGLERFHAQDDVRRSLPRLDYHGEHDMNASAMTM